ncbi:hypothetical protein QOT17_022060 [Balamuthia mandrillaris]
MLCGCGGGFDFVHSMILYPELKRLGKKVVIASYSFGDTGEIKGEAPVVFEEQLPDEPKRTVQVKRVTAESVPNKHYAPEIHMCSFLDQKYPQDAPHSIYAFYARFFTEPLLRKFYGQLVNDHQVDAILMMDGGSDSLVASDEDGLGDPIEDCVSITAVATLDDPRLHQNNKMLLVVGLGADRFNGVSDGSTLRAVAELTQGLSVEATSEGFQCYKDCVQHIYSRQSFRSVLTGCILAAAKGQYGHKVVPEGLEGRVRAGEAFVWPLMAMLWAFDVNKVARRSMLSNWIEKCATVGECYAALGAERAKLEKEGRLRDVEHLPGQQ